MRALPFPSRLPVVGLLLLLLGAHGLAQPSAEGQSRGQSRGPAPSSNRSINAVVSGELVVEPATLINLGFEWFIQGDANRNATVAVSYRKTGEVAWRTALPLLRIGGERIYAESRVDGSQETPSWCTPAPSSTTATSTPTPRR